MNKSKNTQIKEMKYLLIVITVKRANALDDFRSAAVAMEVVFQDDANVVDRNNGRIVATASTVEHALKSSLECGRSCNAKAAAVVGEVLAMRLRVDGLEHGQGRGIHVNVNKEIEKKGFQNRTKIWAVVNALNNNGVKLILEDEDNIPPGSSYIGRQRDDCTNPRD